MNAVITIAVIVAFVGFIIAVARLGRDVEPGIGGLFAQATVPARALRMQENDLPPFRFAALDARSASSGGPSAGADPTGSARDARPAVKRSRLVRRSGHA